MTTLDPNFNEIITKIVKHHLLCQLFFCYWKYYRPSNVIPKTMFSLRCREKNCHLGSLEFLKIIIHFRKIRGELLSAIFTIKIKRILYLKVESYLPSILTAQTITYIPPLLVLLTIIPLSLSVSLFMQFSWVKDLL